MTRSGEGPFISFVDLLTGVVFMLILIVTVVVLLPHKTGPACMIVSDITAAMKTQGYDAASDAQNCRISFRSDGMFAPGSAVLSTEIQDGLIASFAQAMDHALPCYEQRPAPVYCRFKGDLIADILITGHTDHVGSLQANLALSAARAVAFYRALVNKEPNLAAAKAPSPNGGSLIGIAGYGFLRPVVVPPVNADEPRDRRVEIQFIMLSPR